MFEIGSFVFPIFEFSFHGSYKYEKASTKYPSRNSIRLTSNPINWFSWTYVQSKRFPRTFDRWNRIPRRSFRRTFLQEFPINIFCSQGVPINEKCLLFFPVNIFFSEFPLLELDFMAFLYIKSTSMVFASNKLLYIDFQSTYFFQLSSQWG